MIKQDRRVERTKNAIFMAFADLLQEKKYHSITIQEIIDRANVGRTTLYSHFPTKDDLLIAFVNYVFASFNQHLSNHVTESDIRTHPIPVSEIFEHIKNNSRIIKGLFNSEIDDLLFLKVKNHWNSAVEMHLSEYINTCMNPKVPPAILINHITSSLLELARWWITTDSSYSPKQMETYFSALILPSIYSVLNGEDK